MGFWDDFGDGFEAPFKWGYNKLDKADKAADKALDAGNNVLDLLSGNSNTLVYIGIGIVAVAVLPTILNKVL
jgi:hypothetical protein